MVAYMADQWSSRFFNRGLTHQRRKMKTLCIALLLSVVLCGCNATKQVAPFSCPAGPTGSVLTLNNTPYCITASAESYQVELGTQFNTWSADVNIQSNPPLPSGTTLQVGLSADGIGSGSTQVVWSAGQPAMNGISIPGATAMTCLPNPIDVSVETVDAGATAQASWASVPQSCSSN